MICPECNSSNTDPLDSTYGTYNSYGCHDCLTTFTDTGQTITRPVKGPVEPEDLAWLESL